ncbi:MAG: BspA family leucine-rich repeat surface protein, partial [Alphaproteobacteria bacterium]|nr:BspA family leucine-rich repeat surface protein [Alphaproteobacteria bacterium]
MKKLALLTSVITSINCGIAVEIGAERLTVHLEDLVDNRYIDYKYRSGEFKKRYEDAKRFREYIEATFSKGTLIIEDTKEHRIKHIDAILLKKLCHIESEDNHPEKMMEVILIFSMIDGKPLAFDKRCCCTNWNIPNLLLHFIFQEMFYEGRSYKVILPPDSFELFGNCNYAEKSSIKSFNFRGATTEFVRDMGFMFRNQNSLTSLDLRNFDTSNVTSMFAMFDGCKNLTSLVLSNFDTSNVTMMYRMFADCGLTSLDLGNFDTRKVTSMDSMFENCDFLKYLDL